MKLSTPLLFYCCIGVTIGIFLRMQTSIGMLYLIVCILFLSIILWKKNRLFIVPLLLCGVFYLFTNQVSEKPSHSIEKSLLVKGDVAEIKTEKMVLLKNNDDYYQVYPKANEPLPKIGENCTVQGEFKGLDTENQSLLKYYFERENIVGTIFVSEMTCVEEKNSYKYLLPKLKESIINKIYLKEYPNASAIIIALSLGETRYLEPDLEDTFRSLGLSHVLAISGSHFTLLTVILLGILKRSTITVRTIILLLLIIFPVYAQLVGMPAAVLRATIMACLLLFTKEFRIAISPQQIFFITYLLVLTYQPLFLFDIGFLYSFSITFMFLTIIPHYYFDFIPSFTKLFQLQIMIAIITLPLSVLLQNKISLIGLVVNPIFSPLFEVILFPFSLITIAILLLSQQIGEFLFNIFENCLRKLYVLFDFFDNLPYSSVPLQESNEMLLVYFVLCIMTLYFGWDEFGKIRRFFVSFILLITFHYFMPYLQGEGELAVLDVEQGDSILLDFPYREEVWLVDTGGKINVLNGENKHQIFRYQLAPALQKRGIHQIDKLVLTHDDTDHLGEAKKVLEKYKVKEIIVGRCNVEKESTKEVIEIANGKGIKITSIENSRKWELDNTTVTVFVAAKTCFENDNNNSLLVHLDDIGGKSALLTGDLETEGEEKLIENHPHILTDILKVGHHGSKTSSTMPFLKKISPEISVISVGKSNRYGHPHSDVLRNLLEVQTKIYRTDQVGDWSYYFRNQK